MKTNRLKSIRTLAAAAMLMAAAGGAGAFDLVDTTGAKQRLADYKGRWVVVNFWATWCAPCVKEIPDIAEFAKAHKDVVVIGVALDIEDGVEKTKAFAKKVGHEYPLVLDEDSKAEKQFGKVRGLPVTKVYDPTGKKIYDRLGVVSKKFLEETTKRKG